MPAFAAPLFGFSLGVLLSWAAGPDAARLSPTTGARGLLAATLFGGMVFGPAAGYLLAYYPDWCFAYWVSSERLGPAPLLLLVLLDAAAPALGFFTAAKLGAARRSVPVLRLSGIPALAAIALLLGHAGRLRVFGTYAQYHGDFGLEHLAGSPLGYAILWSGLVVILGAAWTASRLALFARDLRD